MSIVIQALERAKDELTAKYEREIAELDRVIEQFKKLPNPEAGNPESNHFPMVGVVAKRSWQGMAMRDAVHAYLSNYDGPIPFDDLIFGLQARGVWLGDPAKPQRFQANVKTMVVNNRKRFRYDKRKDTVTLISVPEVAASAAV